MSEEAENKVQIKTEPKEEAMETEKEEEKPKKDFVKELYKMHGGDPREVKLENCVMLSRIPTDFMADTHEQFAETIKNILSGGHGLNQETIAKVIRIPKLEDGAPESNALRALICFTDLINKSRCMGRKKDFEDASLIVTTLTELPAELLDISDEDACILGDMVDENGDDDGDDVGEEVDEMIEDDDGHDEHDDDEDMEEDKKEENDDTEGEEKDDEKKDESTKDGDKKDDKKQEVPKKKVYEDEDEKAPFEMQWEGAPEFQWRLCEGPRDEKKLIIDNLLWADLNNVFIYRTIQKATSVDINFPARFTSEGTRASHGKLSLYFPGFVAIMDEALKHLVYFRSGDNRRIKVFLPQTTISLKRKEEFEGKLGRLIKPTPRMMELVIKILPEGYTPTSDDAVNWFPMQSVIDCELVNDEMGKPCAIVKFETAEEAVAAHASKSFINISQKVSVKADPDGKDEKEEDGNVTQCNVFMRGVEAHFGSLLTFYDQKKKAQEQRSNRRKSGGPPQQQQSSTSSSAGQKRPAGSTIRGAAPVPPAKKNRTQSPKRPHGKDNSTTPRGGRGGSGGGSRNSGRGGSSGGGGPRRSSPPSRSAPRSAPRGGGGRGGNPRGGSGSGGSSRGGGRGGRSGGDRGLNRSAPRSSGSNYRNDSFSSSSSQRGPARPDPFSGYGYAQFENRYNNDRPTIDPFGRPVYGNSAFSNNSSSSSFHRGGGDDHRGGNSGSNFSSFQDRRRY